MIYIEKGKPSIEVKKLLIDKEKSPEWVSISQDDVKSLRKEFDSLNKDKIREDLLKEQHYLCAYCMRRIENNGLHATIEHITPLSKSKELALNYNNYICVCKGGADVEISSDRVLCCDGSKKDVEIKLCPLNKSQMDNITYTPDGYIKYTRNRDIQNEIDFILCLNGKINKSTGKPICDTSTQLVKGRRDMYKLYQKLMNKLANGKKKHISSSQIKKIIIEMQNQSKYDEYIGVMLFFLNRKYKYLRNEEK